MFLLVSYSLPNGFLIVEEKLGDLDKVPIKVKYQINAVGKYDNNFVLTRKTEIPSIVNTFEIFFYIIIFTNVLIRASMMIMISSSVISLEYSWTMYVYRLSPRPFQLMETQY